MLDTGCSILDTKKNSPQIYADFVTLMNADKRRAKRESAKISVGISGDQRTIPPSFSLRIQHLVSRIEHRVSRIALIAIMITFSVCCGKKKPQVSLSDMVRIPAGTFLMGSSDEEIKKVVRDLGGGEVDPDIQWFAAERPQHEVHLEEFYIDKYEVTNAQYKEFVQATGRSMPRHWEGGSYPDGKADHPVVYVSWEDANAYCRWAGKRLPTEAEWEKAARGTDARIWPWGNTFDITKCNVESWEGSGSTPVGSYPDGVSPYGVYDMAGNVWEWTDSWYDAYPGSTYTTTEFGKKLRVLRGGSWYHYDSLGPIGARCASRDRQVSQSISYVAGFRCAISTVEIAS